VGRDAAGELAQLVATGRLADAVRPW
jgi:hypothetical protein